METKHFHEYSWEREEHIDNKITNNLLVWHNNFKPISMSTHLEYNNGAGYANILSTMQT